MATTALQSWTRPTEAELASSDRRLGNLGYWNMDAAHRTPDKVALIDLSGEHERTLTYGALDQRLDRVAAMLTASGMRPGDRLAISLTNRLEYIEAMFGAMRAGIVPVPLNTKLGADALDYVVRDAGCTGAIVEEAATPHAKPTIDALGCPVRVRLHGASPGWQDYESALAAAGDRFEPPLLAPDHMSLPALHVGLHRTAEGRRPHPCRAVLVAALHLQVLAVVGGDPHARRRAALPQERDGRRDQADAGDRRLHGDPAEF